MAHEPAIVRFSRLFRQSSGTNHQCPYSPNPPTFTKFPLLYIRSLLTLPYDQDAKRRLAWTSRWMVRENAYSMQQGTRPQTLGYALSDSPVGLLAWIYEKLVAWTDKYPWTDDEGAYHHPASAQARQRPF